MRSTDWNHAICPSISSLQAELTGGVATSSCQSFRLWDRDAMRNAQAEIDQLNTVLLGHASATLTLEHWCETHHLAKQSKVLAQRIERDDKILPEDLKYRLGIRSGEPVKYRRVLLTCGDRVLSKADNWYRPGLLSVSMNNTLETTQTPFGKVVAPLRFTRRFISVNKQWPAHGNLIPYELLQHRALLYTRDGIPFSALIETYTNKVLSQASHMPVDR